MSRKIANTTSFTWITIDIYHKIPLSQKWIDYVQYIWWTDKAKEICKQ